MTLPNFLSALRLFLILPLVFNLLKGDYGTALVILAVAGVSDLLDGFLARTFNWRTKLGSILDPIADKLLILALTLSLVKIGELPIWLVVVILIRDLQVTLGFLLVYFRKQGKQGFIQPLFTGKLAVASQIVTGVLVLLKLHYAWNYNLQAIFIICGVLTIVSDLHYTLRLLSKDNF